MSKHNKDSPDLYKILGLKYNCTNNEIKLAYKKLIAKYHPDKGGDPEIFEIVTNSYNILINPQTRREYDDLYATQQSSQLGINLKEHSKQFISNQNTVITEKDNNTFKQEWENLNKRHNYKPNSINEPIFDKFAFLQTERERNDSEMIDIVPKVFDTFDPLKFNSAFEEINGKMSAMVNKKDVPDAWNGQSHIATEYSNVDDVSIYDDAQNIDEINCMNYGPANFNMQPAKRITREIIKDINNNVDYDGHAMIDDIYLKNVDEKLKLREEETNKFNNKELFQYDVNNMAGYGIFDKLGINHDESLKLLDSDKNITDAYNRLLQDRQI